MPFFFTYAISTIAGDKEKEVRTVHRSGLVPSELIRLPKGGDLAHNVSNGVFPLLVSKVRPVTQACIIFVCRQGTVRAAEVL